MTRPPPGPALAGALLLAAVAGGLFFHDLGRYPLWDPDEARHAEVARELHEARGFRRLFLPTLELEPYREKPAPYYWLVALAYGALGIGAGAARAPGAVAAFLTVLAVYLYALPRSGVAGALGAGLVLATSAGFFGPARYGTLDMTLTACVSAGVLAGLAWLDRAPPRRPLLAPYVAAGLAALVKGPLGLALVAGPLGLAIALRRPRPAVAELGLVRGLAILTGILAVLYVPVALLDASYLREFLVTNVRRFEGTSPHAAPVYYYLRWLPLLLLPWTILALPALGRAALDPVRRPLVLWAAFVPALLTLARGKLPTYVLSAVPPLALVAGPEIARAALAGPAPGDAWAARVTGWLALGALAVGAVSAAVAGHAYPLSAWGRVLLGAAAVGWGAALALALRADRLALVPLAVLGAMLTLYPLAVRFVAPVLSTLRSDEAAARLIAGAEPGPVIAWAGRASSLVFYLRGPVIWTEDAALVRDLFEGDAPVFLVTGRRHFDDIERLLGDRAHRWHSTVRRRLYANRPPPGG